MYKAFELIIDQNETGELVKYHRAGKTVKEVRESFESIGEVIRIKDVSENFPLDANLLENTISKKFGKEETSFIMDIIFSEYPAYNIEVEAESKEN